jgi:polyhydroxyalkanoate synthesis regulator phasin
MLRFTIRDVLWLTAVVAIGVGWGVEATQSARKLAEQAVAMDEMKRDHAKEMYVEKVRHTTELLNQRAQLSLKAKGVPIVGEPPK